MQVTIKYPKWHETLDQSKTLTLEYPGQGKRHAAILEELFALCGNHPENSLPNWAGYKMRSMSVGDFVSLDGFWYQVAGCGFIKVSRTRVKKIMNMPKYDTWADKALR